MRRRWALAKGRRAAPLQQCAVNLASKAADGVRVFGGEVVVVGVERFTIHGDGRRVAMAGIQLCIMDG